MAEQETKTEVTPPVDAPPADKTPEAPAQPFAVFPDQASFDARIQRASRAKLREMGVESPEQLKEMQDTIAKLQSEAEERRQAEMSELEREREQRIDFEQKAKAAEEAAEEANYKAYLYTVFANKGVRNFEYAEYECMRKAASVGEDDTWDPEQFVDELLADESKSQALGIPVEVKTRGATDTDKQRDPAPRAPGSNGQTGPAVNEMSKEQFNHHLQNKYGFSRY